MRLNATFWLVLVGAVLLAAGCDSMPFVVDDRPLPAAPQVQPEAKAIGNTAQAIRTEAQSITTTARDGANVAPLLPHWLTILENASTILAQTVALDESAGRLRDAQGRIDALEAACAQLKSDAARAIHGKDREIAKLKSDASKWERKAWFAFSIAGGLALVAAGVLAFLGSPKLGMVVALAGGTAIAVGTLMASWSWLVGLVLAGLVVLVGVIAGLTIWQRARGETMSARGMAKMAHATLSDGHEENIREFFAALRGDWKEFDREMRSLTV
jgi:hypothetical protein